MSKIQELYSAIQSLDEKKVIELLSEELRPTYEEIRATQFKYSLFQFSQNCPQIISALIDAYGEQLCSCYGILRFTAHHGCYENVKMLCERLPFSAAAIGDAFTSAAKADTNGHLNCLAFLIENYDAVIDSGGHYNFKALLMDPFALICFRNTPNKFYVLLQAARHSNPRMLDYLLNIPSIIVFADFDNNQILNDSMTKDVCKTRLLKIPAVALLHYSKIGNEVCLRRLLQENKFASHQIIRAFCIAINNGHKHIFHSLVQECEFDENIQSLIMSILEENFEKTKDFSAKIQLISAQQRVTPLLLFLLEKKPSFKNLVLPIIGTHNIPLPLTKDNIKYGPLNKNLSTQALELLYEIILKAPTHVKLHIKDGELFATIDTHIFNISTLFKKAELSHVHLASSPLLELTQEEIKVIQDYTCSEHCNKINDMLYAKISEAFSDQELKNVFCQIILLAAALNKIGSPQKSDVPSFRMESCVSDNELDERKRNIYTEKGAFTRMVAFSSTSSEETVVRGFHNFAHSKSIIMYDTLSGMDISSYSYFPEQKEHVLQSHVVMWESFDESVKPILFKAKVLRPLVEDREAITHNEIETFLFLTSKAKQLSIVADLTPHALNFLQIIDNDLLLAAKEVYQLYLSHPYERDDYGGHYFLNTPKGIIYRPNHGLAHTLRKMMLVPQVVKALNLDLSHIEIKKLQLASLFFVVGRKNECAASEDKELYLSFRHASAEAFKKYAIKIGMDTQEIQKFYDLVLNLRYYVDPQFENDANYDYSFIVNIAHNLDLIRCYSEDELNKEVIKNGKLNNRLSTENIKILLNYARDLIIATGDTVSSYQGFQAHNKLIFHACSTNVAYCLESIFRVPRPVLKHSQNLIEKTLSHKRKRMEKEETERDLIIKKMKSDRLTHQEFIDHYLPYFEQIPDYYFPNFKIPLAEIDENQRHQAKSLLNIQWEITEVPSEIINRHQILILSRIQQGEKIHPLKENAAIQKEIMLLREKDSRLNFKPTF